MGKLSRFWSDQDTSVVDHVLTEKMNPDYELPSYVHGEFMSTGPSQWTMGDRSYSHVLDGFGRLSKWSIKEGEVKMTSSLLDCKWYNKCKEANNLIPGASFRETSPPRWQS